MGKLYMHSSDLGISIILIMFVMGYGIVAFESISYSGVFLIGSVGFTCFRYIWCIVAFFLSKKYQGYHDYEGVLGNVEIFISFAQAVWFFFAWKNTFIYSGGKFAGFVKIIIRMGLIFFAFKPSIILVVEFLAPQNRRLFVFLTEHISH